MLACKSKGIRHVVISPGSRNAPLTLSFTDDPFFECFSIVDERSAAFFAMGIAQQNGTPAIVVCTSGSALLNYYPAVAEAFYSDIPLVVLSSDRPPYKIDIGDGQTIRQDYVFHRHIGYSANLRLDTEHASDTIGEFAPDLLRFSQAEIDDHNASEIGSALAIALEKRLPVHINIPMEEPLYGTKEYKESDDQILPANVTRESINPSEETAVRELWATSNKKMVLVGVNPPGTVNTEYLERLANDPSVLVFTETTSNLYHPNFFSSIDSIIFPVEKSKEADRLFQALQPDILLTFGGLVVSKKIKAFLRKYEPKVHWHVHENKAYDTYFALTKHFRCSANTFLASLPSDTQSGSSSYRLSWDALKAKYKERRLRYLDQIPFSDFVVFSEIMATIPNGFQVQLSNSSTVRYAQLFEMHPSLAVYCNRGTSGIDGSTSTAIGAAFHSSSPTLLITGDLSFFYDSNAFWNQYVRSDFRVILVNNAGGGIFRILPGFDNSDRFAKYFETAHTLTAAHICAQFGLDYVAADNVETLKESLRHFYDPSEKPKLLEVFTPREVNNKILLEYFDFISSEYI